MEEINTEQVFKQIKKQNGEAVAQALFEGVLLDIPNIKHILEFAGRDRKKVEALFPVIREIYKEKIDSEYQTDKNPLELLSEKGYDAFVVTNEAEKNSIRKYYRPGEEICTFRDPVRHKNYYMIHAVKRGADKIKPSDNPERDDEYGTSVISIQIAKTGGFISIKNRYNHTVNNPDATFNNNPDNIIRGLTNSLKDYFNVDFNVSNSVLPDNFRMVNDQLVYFDHEINNTYFGSNYYFSGSTITKLKTSYERMLDYFVLDERTGEVKDIAGTRDSACHILQEKFRNKKISIQQHPDNKHERRIYADGVYVLSVENGAITELDLSGVKNTGENFLMYNKKLRKLYAPDLEVANNYFLSNNEQLTQVDFPKLRVAGHWFLRKNRLISSFNAPYLESVHSCFLEENLGLEKLYLPSLRELGDYSLKQNVVLSRFFAPKLEIFGPVSLISNERLTELSLPCLREMGSGSLSNNRSLRYFNAPNLEKIGDHVMVSNLALTELNLPELLEVGENFLEDNKVLERFYAPKLQTTWYRFLASNTELTEFVVASDNVIHKDNKRLRRVLAWNKFKKEMSNMKSWFGRQRA